MQNKKTTKIDSGLATLSVLGILLIINFFSYDFFLRADLTENKDYSISESTKKTANNLKDVVNIKAYFSSNVPPQYITLKQNIEDILKEYASYSSNKIQYEFIDPSKMEDMTSSMSKLHIPQVQFNIYNKDKYQSINGYLGIIVKYGKKQELLPVVQSTDNFEYALTLAIKKVTNQKLPTIGIIGDSTGDAAIGDLKTALAKYYGTNEFDTEVGSNAGMIKDVDTLLVTNSKKNFSDNTLKVIDDFIMSGKPAIFLTDGVNVNGLTAQENKASLHGLIEKYGVKINNDLISDVSSGVVMFTQGYMNFMMNYPFWPKITEDNFNKNNIAVSKLSSATFPWVSSLTFDQKINPEATATYLMKSTSNAWKQSGKFDLEPKEQDAKIEKKGVDQYIFGYLVSGKIKSAYNKKTQDHAKLIVLGDSDFIIDRVTKQYPENLTLMQNMVDYLSIDEGLIKIRSKTVSSRPIKIISDNTRLTIRYLNVFGVTIVVVCFGMLRYYIRRKKLF
ncbi:MAG: GldG family protein [Candidatus Falkowbacteria bacterium]|nr:GldG family protein [Candidatus Falkowbacteria bacterium]